MKISIRAITMLTTLVIASFGVQAISPTVRASSGRLGPTGLDPSLPIRRDEAQKNKWAQEAREFDTAIREIDAITRLDLNTQQGSDEAVNILKRNEGKLGFAESKMAAGVLKVEKFKKGVEDEAKKRGGNKKFADEINKDASAAKNIPGLEDAGREAEASIKPAHETLKRVAAAFEAASKKQSSYLNPLRLNLGDDFVFAKASYTPAETCAVSLVNGSGADNFCQSLGINIPLSACLVIKAVILVMVDIPYVPTCINNCIRSRVSSWINCMGSANRQIFPQNVLLTASCNKTLISRTADCYLYGCIPGLLIY